MGKVVPDTDWRVREEEKLLARNDNFDVKKSARATKVRVGDWVMIRKPVKKGGFPGRSKLVRVVKLFTNAVKTEDSRIWNLNRVVVINKDAVGKGQEFIKKDSAIGVRKSERKIVTPKYLEEYVT
ncbi:hypothetical protein NDU88_003044 [Pleurodeles waltl]|uniref:Uncharacterized protein n=1 Tax=Pleurodeles waltl TaxID=8319 RepID=A0AAV7V160_PLEWA|nr:hypothetical protein NDU88_003044 [Pleurodeles waltl]